MKHQVIAEFMFVVFYEIMSQEIIDPKMLRKIKARVSNSVMVDC